MDPQSRPSKRSKPVSQLVLRAKNHNTMALITPTPGAEVENGKHPAAHRGIEGLRTLFPLKRKHREMEMIKKVNTSSLTKLVSNTPIKAPEQHSRQQTSRPSFKVFQELPQLHETANTQRKPASKKISDLELELSRTNTAEISSPSIDTPITPYFQFNLSLNATDPESLLHRFQLPLYHLNNWYRINQYEILPSRNDATDSVYVIQEVEKFNEMITLVTVKRDDEEKKVMLLNYKQSMISFNKFQVLKKGDKIQLIEGLNLMNEYKLYHNWKLVT